ncbi:hypothetical protein [Faecalimonas sp.]
MSQNKEERIYCIKKSDHKQKKDKGNKKVKDNTKEQVKDTADQENNKNKKGDEEKEVDENDLSLSNKYTGILKTVVPKEYGVCRFNKNFEFSELWFVRKGELKILDDIKGDIYELSSGDLIIFPAGSRTKIVITEKSLIKQCLFDLSIKQKGETKVYVAQQEQERKKVNIIINYMIIETILRLTGQYKDFTTIPNETDIIFKRAKTGDLYGKDKQTNFVDQCIDNFAGRTNIAKAVWTGERHLKTGLRYQHEGIEELDSYHIDIIDLDEPGICPIKSSEKLDYDLYNAIKRNPLSLPLEEINGIPFDNIIRENTVYSLNGLITMLILSILKNHGEIGAMYIKNTGLRIHKEWEPYITKKGLPKYVRYGHELKTIVEKLLFVNY